jgi:hypothetical protein
MHSSLILNNPAGFSFMINLSTHNEVSHFGGYAKILLLSLMTWFSVSISFFPGMAIASQDNIENLITNTSGLVCFGDLQEL